MILTRGEYDTRNRRIFCVYNILIYLFVSCDDHVEIVFN